MLRIVRQACAGLCCGNVGRISALSGQKRAQPRPFDVVILHGHIIDGTGSPWYSGDVGIRDGHIAAIGDLGAAPAKQKIDAQGKVVAPGFIDMLGQSELTILVDPRLPSKIYQGITTEITGEGGSVAPVNDAMLAADRAGYEHLHITPDWRTLREYFARLEKQGMGINLATYVGATSVRRMVLGDAKVEPTPAQLEQMKALVDQAMRDGAVGVSTSLQYAPAPYAKTEELIALAREASKYGGIYATHMRSEGDAVLESIDEATRIGREAQIPVEIWHLKAAGKGKLGQDAADCRAHRCGAGRGCGREREYLRVHGMVQHVFGIRSAVGARWRRREADRAAEGSGDAGADSQGHDEHRQGFGRRGLGQRVAGDSRAGGDSDRGGAESGAAAAAGEAAVGGGGVVARGCDRCAVRPADQGQGVHRGCGVRHG